MWSCGGCYFLKTHFDGIWGGGFLLRSMLLLIIVMSSTLFIPPSLSTTGVWELTFLPWKSLFSTRKWALYLGAPGPFNLRMGWQNRVPKLILCWTFCSQGCWTSVGGNNEHVLAHSIKKNLVILWRSISVHRKIYCYLRNIYLDIRFHETRIFHLWWCFCFISYNGENWISVMIWY